MMNKNHSFYMKADLTPYIGKWIAISNGKIISQASNAKDVYLEAKKKYPNKRPFIVKVPGKETMIF